MYTKEEQHALKVFTDVTVRDSGLTPEQAYEHAKYMFAQCQYSARNLLHEASLPYHY